MRSDLPKGWKKVRLGELITLEYGKGLTEKDRKPGSIPVYGSSGILGYHNQPLIMGRGVIVGRKGQVGMVHYSKTSFWPIDTVFYVRENRNYDIRFIYYLLKYVNLPRLTGDSAVPGLKREIAYQEEVAIPTDISEQHKIAEILGSLDDKIELNYETNKTLEAIAQAIFKNWFVDFEPFKDELVYNEELGKEIPKGWEVKMVGDLFNLIKGKKCELSERYRNGYFPYLLIETFEKGIVKYWTSEKQPFVNVYDIVLVADGERSGKILRFKDGILGSTLLMLKQAHNVSDSPDIRNYVYLLLKTKENELMQHRTGSAVPHLDNDYLASLKIHLPPSSVIDDFNRIVRPLFEIVNINLNETVILNKIKDELLPKLLSGEIRVRINVEKEFPEEAKKLEEIREEKIKLQESLEKWFK